MVNRSLPDGWEWKTLEDVLDSDGVFIDGDWVESKDQDPEGEIRLIQLADVGDGYYRNRSNRFLTHEKALELGCTFLEKGDLLIARMPDPLGRACIFPGDKKQSVTVVDVCIVRTKNAEHRWLMHAINSPQFRADVESLQSGSTRKRISRKNLAKLKLPFPPLPEQERIVSRIEELFSDLEAGVAALERVRAGLRRYKASVLKAACEGMLLKDEGGWVKDESKLPEGWKWVTLEELSSDANYGTSQKCDYNENEFPVVRIPNIISGNIELSDLKFAIDGSGLRDKDSLAPGDLLIVRTNGSRDLIGKSALIRRPLEKQLYFASYLIRYRIADYENVGSWIATIWDSPFIRAWIETVVSTTAGQYNLNIAKLNKLPIPLPPLDEQQRIVAEVERRLSVVGEVESAVEAGLARAAKLRQAILKHAFEGKL